MSVKSGNRLVPIDATPSLLIPTHFIAMLLMIQHHASSPGFYAATVFRATHQSATHPSADERVSA